MKIHNFIPLLPLALGQDEGPITKVVTLLKELKGRIDTDEKTEQNVYNKYACWCETTTDRKAQAIAKAREDIAADGRKVLELKAKVALLTSKIKKKTEEVAESEKSIATLTQIRKKNHANFMAVNAEMEQAIEALHKAVGVLGGAGTKHVLLQSPEFMSLYSTLNHVISLNNINKKELKLAQELVQKFTPSADDGSGTYSPASATIIGILKSMHESFSSDLKEATETEKTQVENFDKASSKLEETIGLLQEQITKAQREQAETETTLTDTDQRLLDTSEQLADDVEFFDKTKSACTAKSTAWTKRQELRHEELKGITEALELLTADENRALFDKSIKPGLETFLQIDANRAPRSMAFRMVAQVASQSKSLRLAALAASIRTGRFDAVIKQIDTILVEMKEEEQTDITNRDDCISDRHRLNEENKKDKHAVKVSEGKIARKERIIEKNNVSLEEVATARNQAQEELAELTTQREQENADFKEAKTDDETAVKLLDDVVDKLGAFHKEHGAGLLQEPVFEVSKDHAPDATFSDKAGREGESKGILSLLRMIQDDLKSEIANGIKDEAEAQKAFEEQRDSINALVDSLDKKEISLKESNAARQGEIDDENTEIETKNGEIAATDEELDGLKKGCDWLVKNFEKRATKRSEEAVALQNAKGVLAGAGVSLVARKAHMFNDAELPSVKFTSLSFLQRPREHVFQ